MGLLLAALPAVAADTASPAATPATHHAVKEAVVVMPTTYADAVDAIDVRVQNIARLIGENKLDGLHIEAAVIKKIAAGMSKLVAADGSGVPKEAYPEVLTASKTLASLFGRVDSAGDSGNLEESKKAHAALAEQFAVLRKHAPAKQAAAPPVYACPMHADVTSDAPGKCSKCGMALVKKGGS